MSKILMGPQRLAYPQATVIVGTNVDDKPNFMAVGSCGDANNEPPMISVTIQHPRYTNIGIKQNMTFSVNVPSVDLIRETDYCGIVSGSKVNKAEVCQFGVFYGKLNSAPLIEQCPINLECKVVHTLDLGFFIGRIEETHITESYLTDGKPDINKIKPFIYVSLDRRYLAFGEVIARAYSVGLELKAGE